MPNIDDLFRKVRQDKASDLHLLQGQPPKYRVHGELIPIDGYPKLDEDTTQQYLYEIATDDQIEKYEAGGDLDFAYGLEGVARFRCNYMKHIFGRGAVFRQIPDEILSVDQLGLPPSVANAAHLRSGLVLVTGPTGSGKSTTLAAVIDLLNRTYEKHIITIEDPIEFVHQNKKSVITQREVGQHTDSFASALRAAIREDPDVILVGELRDLETISLALTAAELGLLVFGTLHTNSAAKTIDRIIDVFPAGQQPQVRAMLSESLQGVFSQTLLKTKGGKGRVAALEVLTRREGLGNMIREGNVTKIVSMIETGRGDGMQLMDQALLDLVKAGTVTGDDAYMKANNKSLFDNYRSTSDEVE